MCAMLKRASSKDGFITRDSIKEEIERAKEYAISENERQIKRLTDELNTIKKNVHEFETASGVYLERIESDHFWGNPKEMGEAFKFLRRSGGADGVREDLVRLEGTAKKILEDISNGLKTLEPKIPCGQNNENK